jgi:hypothetical protein
VSERTTTLVRVGHWTKKVQTARTACGGTPRADALLDHTARGAVAMSSCVMRDVEACAQS